MQLSTSRTVGSAIARGHNCGKPGLQVRSLIASRRRPGMEPAPILSPLCSSRLAGCNPQAVALPGGGPSTGRLPLRLLRAMAKACWAAAGRRWTALTTPVRRSSRSGPGPRRPRATVPAMPQVTLVGQESKHSPRMGQLTTSDGPSHCSRPAAASHSTSFPITAGYGSAVATQQGRRDQLGFCEAPLAEGGANAAEAEDNSVAALAADAEAGFAPSLPAAVGARWLRARNPVPLGSGTGQKGERAPSLCQQVCLCSLSRP